MRTHRLLLGTHTSGQSIDYLRIAHIELPKPPAATIADYNPNSEGEAVQSTSSSLQLLVANVLAELGGYGASKETIKFNVVQRIVHPGEVNKARYQPQNLEIIATWASNKNIYVWDRTKHSMDAKDHTPKPQATLQGHTEEAGILLAVVRDVDS